MKFEPDEEEIYTFRKDQAEWFLSELVRKFEEKLFAKLSVIEESIDLVRKAVYECSPYE